jgi:hypothetical protein
MRISRYDEAEGGEIKLEACEDFFRYRVHIAEFLCDKLFQMWNNMFLL